MQDAAKADTVSDTTFPIIDCHHHLLANIPPVLAKIMHRDQFTIDDYIKFLGEGSDVVATVAVKARCMYRVDGPESLRPVGETDFLNAQATLAAGGSYGGCRVAAGIVSFADLRLGDSVAEVLEAHRAAAPQRFKGVRQGAVWDADPLIVPLEFNVGPNLYADDRFRAGFRRLAPLGLSFDAFIIEPQLSDVIDLARSFPDTQIILNHLGHPIGVRSYAGTLDERYPIWKRNMSLLASSPNVVTKMGGLGSFLSGSPTYRSDPPASIEVLAAEWRPYVEAAIELFGPGRCMFESNTPTDGSGSFGSVTAAYRSLLSSYTQDEKRSVFAQTADRVYGLGLAI